MVMASKSIKVAKAKKVLTSSKVGSVKLLKFAKKSAGKSGDFDPTGVIVCTAKVSSANLLLQQRCIPCHGMMVRDVVGRVTDEGKQYKMADLRYDIKGGRLKVLPSGSKAGAIPKGKPRADAPLAGQKMPEASFDEFFQFLQGQLRMEVREHTGAELKLSDQKADDMWPDVEAFVRPNLGATERWVPYHTILGVHELFLVEAIHSRKKWSEYQRFLAMFIFRAHCKRDLFTQAQLPIMLKEGFWKDPKAAFEHNGAMEKSILSYRKKTKAPLITSCFRIIPPRELANDDANLVRSIINRSWNLLNVAEDAWSILKKKTLSPVQKISEISAKIQEAPGCGETWAKMLTVCIDLAYPKEQFLEKQCDVGTGAAPPLRCLLSGGGTGDMAKDLKTLLNLVNASKSVHAKHFWATLKKAEDFVRGKFKSLPLVCAQANTKAHSMTACVLQVQLCEYRQFRHSIARLKYGLPDDEKMRGGDEGSKVTLQPENFVELNEKKKCVEFDIPLNEKKIHFEVPLKSVGNRKMVAARVAAMCFIKIREGMPKPQVEKFRDELVAGHFEDEDVKDSSEAWAECKTQLAHACPLVSFQVDRKGGKSFAFQTTKLAAGGNILECERIARLCWEKLQKGMDKDKALEYRNNLYKKRAEEDGNLDRPLKKARK